MESYIPAGSSVNVMVFLEQVPQETPNKNYQVNPKEIITYLTPWKVILMVSNQKS